MPSAVPRRDASGIRDEVESVQAAGRLRIDAEREHLEDVTKGARGASAKAADDVKEW